MLNKLILRARRDERGASLVMVAFTMVILLGITAFVVDLGMGYNERRVSQTSADAAALGGIQYIGSSRAKASEEAIEVARESLRAEYTDAQWTALWTAGDGCPSSAPSGYAFAPSTVIAGTTTSTKCVMFNDGNTRMRVRIPNQIITTSFGKVLGTSQLKAAATAEAEISFGGQGGVLPFGVLGQSGGDGQEICLRDGPGGLAIPPCNGPDSGNFGAIDSPFYGNDQYGTTTQCTGSTNGRLLWNIVKGIDHLLDEYRWTGEDDYSATETLRQDDPSPGCNAIEDPNWLTTQTGAGSYLHDAFIDSNSPAARLRNTPYSTRRVTGVDGIDNWPLWKFIPTTLVAPAIPASCERLVLDAAATKAALTACFDAYNNPPAGTSYEPLFSLDSDPNDNGVYDIQKSPRFAFIPEFWTSDPSDLNGTQQLGIKRFRSVFIQTLYIDCTGTGCGTVFDPGDSTSGSLGDSNKKAQMMSAMMFNNSMLPDRIWKTGPGGSLRGATIALIN